MAGTKQTYQKQWLELQPNASERSVGVIFKAQHRQLPAAVVIRRLAKKLDRDLISKICPKL